MRRFNQTFFLSVILGGACFGACQQKTGNRSGGLEAQHLRAEFLVNPRGIDVKQPRLSWETKSTGRGVLQNAYRILVASSPEKLENDEGDLWDSDRVESAETAHIEYTGKPLKSRDMACWKVKIWDNKGNESEWSEPAYWTVGLLEPSDWQAKWTGLDTAFSWDEPREDFTRLSARYFRKEFDNGQPVKHAMVYISGLGLYELYVNGERIGDQVLAPGPTEYDKRAFYNTFEVTDQLKQGKNALGVILGNGRFYTVRWGETNTGIPPIAHYGYPKMRLQLEIEYEDGTTQTLISDDSWKVTADGPGRANNEFDGAEYDARKEMPGWNLPDFDESGWMQAQLVENPTEKLVAQMNEPIRVTETIKPVSVKEVSPGVFIFDMGQNMVGWTRLNVQGEAGDVVQLRFAERLSDDSSAIYLDNIRQAKVTDKYILKGEGTEVWEPKFTYHGFRYVEVSGYPGTPDLDALEGKVVHDDLRVTGHFETSSEIVNQIYKNAVWGIRGNYRGMPTDCPQRDERMGWLGDRAMGSKGESFIFDQQKLYAKWLQDIEDAQSPEGSIPDVAPAYWKMYSDNMTWPGAYPIIANMLYEQFGDRRPVEKHYDSMKKWLQYMRDKYMQDFIMTKDTYGDWCMPPESPELIHSQDPTRKTPGDYLGTSFYYHMLTLMERFARISGHEADTAQWQALAGNVKKAFNDRFFRADSGYYVNNTVTANIFALAYDLAPADVRERVFEHIVHETLDKYKGHISTGLVGAQWLMRTLTNHGRPDIAWQLVTNTSYPSWGYMVEHGATTIWELWNGNTADPAMNSMNHVMLLGDLITWYYENLAGIRTGGQRQTDPESAGFKRIIMKPSFPEGLDFVTASYHSVRGEIKSSWKRTGDGLEWKITIPANTTALIYIPASDQEEVQESGKPAADAEGVRFVRMEGNRAGFEAGSGSYRFTSARLIQ